MVSTLSFYFFPSFFPFSDSCFSSFPLLYIHSFTFSLTHSIKHLNIHSFLLGKVNLSFIFRDISSPVFFLFFASEAPVGFYTLIYQLSLGQSCFAPFLLRILRLGSARLSSIQFSSIPFNLVCVSGSVTVTSVIHSIIRSIHEINQPVVLSFFFFSSSFCSASEELVVDSCIVRTTTELLFLLHPVC